MGGAGIDIVPIRGGVATAGDPCGILGVTELLNCRTVLALLESNAEGGAKMEDTVWFGDVARPITEDLGVKRKSRCPPRLGSEGG